MFCHHCGVTNPDDSSQCVFCGQRFPVVFNWRRIAPRAAIALVVPPLVYWLFTRFLL